MVELEDVAALQTTSYELGMEMENAKEEKEEIEREVEAVKKEKSDMLHDVHSARQRIETAERKRKAAEAQLDKEKRKSKELRREKKNKGDALRYYEQKTAEARKNFESISDVQGLEAENEVLRDHVKTLADELKDAKAEIMENEVEMENLREKDDEIETMKNGKYTPETITLVWSLLNANVAHEKIPGVIKSCLEFCGKTATNIPTAKTIGSMNLSRLAVSQKQLEVKQC